MKKLIFVLIVSTCFYACDDLIDENQNSSTIVEDEVAGGRNHRAIPGFNVTIENVSQPKLFFGSGNFGAGPAFPGDEYSFTFNAPPGSYLSFATMFVQSNDLFLAPGESGIPLYDGSTPKSGDITDYIQLWDAGTEVNEEPGVGPNQAPRQSGPNTGPTENGVVQLVNDGYIYDDVDEIVEVTLTSNYGSASGFKVVIKNISGTSILPSPFAPGVYVVHTAPAPLFEEGAPDPMNGLEGLAEDGSNGMLISYLSENTGLATPFSPGLWAIQKAGTNPLFQVGTPDNGKGLENIAEDGDPTNLLVSFRNDPDVRFSQVFNTPAGAGGPAPIFPGEYYEFEFPARPGSYLNFATMFIQSNDLFVGPGENGIALFDKYGSAISGDITEYVALWDAGTEVNEFPGAGPNQAPRQSGPNTGEVENGNVRMVDDGYDYPALNEVIKITITPTTINY